VLLVRLVIARCSVDYAGRLTAHLPLATRLIMIKADGSVSIHSDTGSYKPLNWMSPPGRLAEEADRWVVTGKSGETLTIYISEVLSDSSFALGVDPGLVKDGVESHLQELLAAQVSVLDAGWRLVRREYPTAIGPVDLLCRDALDVSVAARLTRDHDSAASTSAAVSSAAVSSEAAASMTASSKAATSVAATVPGRPRHWAIEVKRRATIDAVEQLTRYLELLNRDPLLAPVGGVLAAQSFAVQARTLAEDRDIRCVVLDYDAMRGMPSDDMTLF
jgi:endonuclease